MIALIRGKNESNDTEFYFTELESYEDLDVIVNIIKQIGAILIISYDGIYSREAEFQMNKKRFKILYHEDIGIYAISNNELDTEWLYKVLLDIIATLNV